MNWKIWLVLVTILCSSGYYLYTNNVKSKVQSELLKEQIIVDTLCVDGWKKEETK